MFVHIISTAVIDNGYNNTIVIEFQFSRLEEPKTIACRRGWFDSVMVGKQVRMVEEYGKFKFYGAQTNVLHAELG